MIIKCGLKIYLIMSVPHEVKLIFLQTASIVQLFDIWQIICNSLKCFFDLLNYRKFGL